MKIIQKLTRQQKSVSLFATTAVLLYLSYLNHSLKPNTNDKVVNKTLSLKKLPSFVVRLTDPSLIFPEKKNTFWCIQPHMLSTPLSKPAALASYPGSGNTWLRYLLQQATGICTGSLYHDIDLMKDDFAEGITNGSCLVVNVHEYEYWYNAPTTFKSVILLLRDPRDAILSYFNFQRGGPDGFALRYHFDEIDWKTHFTKELERWEEIYNVYLSVFPKPMHIVFYETLVKDTRKILQGILNFLNVTITWDDMECVMENKDAKYRRKRRKTLFDPFTVEMYKQIKNVKYRVYKKVYNYLKKNKNAPADQRSSSISNKKSSTQSYNVLPKIS